MISEKMKNKTRFKKYVFNGIYGKGRLQISNMTLDEYSTNSHMLNILDFNIWS